MTAEEGASAERAEFRAALVSLRSATGQTVPEVAEAFGVSPDQVQKWQAEKSRHRPRAGWRMVLADLALQGAADLTDRAVQARELAASLTNSPDPA